MGIFDLLSYYIIRVFGESRSLFNAKFYFRNPRFMRIDSVMDEKRTQQIEENLAHQDQQIQD